MAALRPRLLMFPPYHSLMAFSKFFGVRDRLRCPKCGSVGTWKPHGSFWFDREDQRAVRRWMCKWCGLYVGPEGVQQVVSDPNVKAWQLVKDAGPGSMTPEDAVNASSIAHTWPWRG